MSAQNYAQALAWVLLSEGGYVHDPHDSGGATNFGITQRVYTTWRHMRKLLPKNVRGIVPTEVSAIYREQYWDACRCDELPSGVDYCTFDLAVNSGVLTATRFLQRAVGADTDGHIGVLTLRAAETASARLTILRDCAARLSWLRALTNWKWFGKGWKARVAFVQTHAMELVDRVAK